MILFSLIVVVMDFPMGKSSIIQRDDKKYDGLTLGFYILSIEFFIYIKKKPLFHGQKKSRAEVQRFIVDLLS